jgi:hypothetical protein
VDPGTTDPLSATQKQSRCLCCEIRPEGVVEPSWSYTRRCSRSFAPGSDEPSRNSGNAVSDQGVVTASQVEPVPVPTPTRGPWHLSSMTSRRLFVRCLKVAPQDDTSWREPTAKGRTAPLTDRIRPEDELQ